MTQQELDATMQEIKTRFPGLDARPKMDLHANYDTKTFVEDGRISIWDGSACVTVLDRPDSLEHFINVVRIMSQGQLYSKADEYAAQFYGTPGAELFTERVVKYVELLCEEKRYNEADEVISQHGLDPNLNPTYATRMLMEVDN